jgi:hypothetical protein
MRTTPAVLQDLAERIRALESSRRSQTRTLHLPLLAPLLDGAELPAGSLIELLPTTPAAGAWTLALLLGLAATRSPRSGARDEPRAPLRRLRALANQTLILVDPCADFYPPAMVNLGIDLERTIIVRPRSRAEAHLAFDLSLRCAAVGAVIGVCDRLRGVESQRLKWAAEAGSGLGVVIREENGPSFADLRLSVAPLPSVEGRRRVRVESLRWRGGQEGKALVLEIDDETGDVHLSAELAVAEMAAVGGAKPRRSLAGRRSG